MHQWDILSPGRKWDNLSDGTICLPKNAVGTICPWDKMSPNLRKHEKVKVKNKSHLLLVRSPQSCHQLLELLFGLDVVGVLDAVLEGHLHQAMLLVTVEHILLVCSRLSTSSCPGKVK